MLLPYMQGLDTWDIHTKHYFRSRADLLSYHSGIISGVVDRIHDRLGRPPRLILKDPIMTKHFHYVAQMLPRARFVVIFRDPRDAILSRLNVARRLQNGSKLSQSDIESACHEYNSSYSSIIENIDILFHRMMVVDYDAVVSGKNLTQLEAFVGSEIDPAKVWQSNQTQIEDYSSNPWSTDLYGAALSPLSINRHESELDPEAAAFIVEQCGWVRKAFDF